MFTKTCGNCALKNSTWVNCPHAQLSPGSCPIWEPKSYLDELRIAALEDVPYKKGKHEREKKRKTKDYYLKEHLKYADL